MRDESDESAGVVERRVVVERTNQYPDDEIEMLPRPLLHDFEGELNWGADDGVDSIGRR